MFLLQTLFETKLAHTTFRLNLFEIVVSFRSFRSIRLFDSSSRYLGRFLPKMKNTSEPVTLEQLRQRSNQANELIKRLQQQIEQVKLNTTPQCMAERAKALEAENEALRKQVPPPNRAKRVLWE